MAWQDEMVPFVRTLVNDPEETAKFSDDRLQEAIVVGGRIVSMKAGFSQDFVCNRALVKITPDPTSSATRDENFINLVCVQAACIVDRGSAIKAAGQAIMVQDGASKVDLREQYKAWQAVLAKGWCAVYEEMMDEYVLSQVGDGIGMAIINHIRHCCYVDVCQRSCR